MAYPIAPLNDPMALLNIYDVLNMVAAASIMQLASLTRNDIIYFRDRLLPNEFQQFIFAKNIKILGGINNYVIDFLKDGYVTSILVRPPSDDRESILYGMIRTLQHMLAYPELTPINREIILTSLVRLQDSIAAAPAAGGRRRMPARKRRRTRRSRRKYKIHL